MPSSFPFSKLRECFLSPPSQKAWQDLLALFEQAPASLEREMALEYAKEHLTAWEPSLRVFQKVDPKHPCWKLVRKVVVACHERTTLSCLENDCEHLVELDLLTTHYLPNHESFRKLESLPLLKKLFIDEPFFEDVSMFGELSGVENLHIHFAWKLQTLRGIESFKGLQTLHLDNCLELQETTALQSSPFLNTLVLRHTPLFGVEELEHLPSLIHLQWEYCTSPAWSEIEKCHQLESLALPYSTLSTFPILFFPKVKKLSLYHSQNIQTIDVSGFPALECLDVSCCSQLEEIRGLEHTTQLQSLNMDSCRNIRHLRGFSSLESLTSLHFRKCKQLPFVSHKKELNGKQEIQAMLQKTK